MVAPLPPLATGEVNFDRNLRRNSRRPQVVRRHTVRRRLNHPAATDRWSRGVRMDCNLRHIYAAKAAYTGVSFTTSPSTSVWSIADTPAP